MISDSEAIGQYFCAVDKTKHVCRSLKNADKSSILK